MESIADLTLQGFLELYEQDGPFEIMDGVLIKMSPPKFGHVELATRLLLSLSGYARDLGEVYMEVPFVLIREAKWVKGARVPDLAFIIADRLKAYKAATPDWKEQPLILVPDMVVEIISPTDRYTEVNQKIDRYIEDGVRLIWVIDPQRRSVEVYGEQRQTLDHNGTLSGESVIPGYSIPVAELFK